MDILNSVHSSKVYPEPNTGCWLWSGPTNTKYGRLSVGDKIISAHRYSYTISKGQIPDGLMVCHICDVPTCVNPDHLFIGTAKDNFDDMASKNRHDCTGLSKVGNPKLTIDQVREIRSLKGKFKLREMAKMYDLTIPAVHLILARKTWKE